MNRTSKLLTAAGAAVALSLIMPVHAYPFPQAEAGNAAASRPTDGSPVLWTDRGDVASLDLLNGAGGKEHAPSGKYTFVEEDKNGTAAKFVVTDEHGTKWKVKLGEESQSETAATRLVWAAGYFVDEDYYLPEIHVDNMPKLDRGNQYVSEGGVVRNVRMERNIKGQKKIGTWSWFKGTFADTKELNGLRVMMALIGNWDLKEVNNAIYSEEGQSPRYVISDLGATFGKTGNYLTRSKNNPGDFEKTKFIQKVMKDKVDFYMNSRPFILTAVDVPNYATRTKMQSLAKDIPRADAKWLGKLLLPLTDEQIRDCFRAAGYTPEQVEGNAAVIRERIVNLNAL